MSAGELQAYNKLRANETLTMPGRLGVKESLQSIYAHLVGADNQVQAKAFQFCTPTSYFGLLFVDSVRMDISNQSILADAAFIPCHIGVEMVPLVAVLGARRDNIVCIKMKEDEITFWKHILPGFAERCRQWQHKSTCEYKIAGCIPVSTVPGKRYMCTCGYGVFPTKYLKDVKQSKDLFKYAVRVAVPVIFASPINTDDPGTFTTPPQHTKPHGQASVHKLEPHLVDLSAKEHTCFECGAKRCEDGAALFRCARCKMAQYCSAECQRQDWKKNHKQLCAQLKQD
jgi:hypothetical protein